MGKFGKLAKNTSIFLIANLGSKLLSFLFVRVYTEYLTTQEYGVIDLLNTTVGLSVPVITLCLTEAVFRFSLDDEKNRGKILTTGLSVTLIGNLVFVLCAPLLNTLEAFEGNVIWLCLLIGSNSLYSIFTLFLRGIGKSKLFALSGLVHSALQIGLNILFLVVFDRGMSGYFAASVLANVITSLFAFFSGKIYAYIVWRLDKKYLRKMLAYAVPMIPNAVLWWIMQSSDRFVITYMLSSADNGVYAVANKIPTLITLISGTFFQAWQISAVEEIDSNQKNAFFSTVFRMLSTVLIIATSALMVTLKPIYWVLADVAYHKGWTSTPYLLCAMVFSCFAGFLDTFFLAAKKTSGSLWTTTIGTVLNILLNFVLTPVLGIKGTALATLIAFLATWVSRIFGTRKFAVINYPIKTFWLPMGLLLVQASLLTFGVESIVIQLGMFVLIVFAVFENVVDFIKTLLRKFCHLKQ